MVVTRMLLLASALVVACDRGDDGEDVDPTDSDTPTGVETETETDTEQPTDSETDTVVTPGCVLGWGETSFTALSPGDEVDVVRGPQGGWHVDAGVQCEGIEPGGRFASLDPMDVLNADNPTVAWTLMDGSTVLAGYGDLRSYKRPMDLGEGDIGMVGERLVFRFEATPAFRDAIDRDATMQFVLDDVDGVHLEMSVAVRLVAWPGWTPIDTGPAATDTP